jgi:phosphoadenosine phosphosulfate reductase
MSAQEVTRPQPSPADAPSAELQEEIDQVGGVLEGQPAEAVLAWAVARFGKELLVAHSFQDPVLVDLAVAADPGIEVALLNTGAHFPETLEYVETLRSYYKLNLTTLEPAAGAEEWPCPSAQCCQFRKVAPLRQALAARPAWITGLKRVDTPERHDAPVVGWDANFGLVKINPIAAWSEDDVDDYIDTRGLPRHPLNAWGYRSIGCAPTTKPVAPGEDPRSGRWAGMGKTECGLHVS